MELQSIRIAGHSVEYRRIGARVDGAPTIVFLHEGLGSARLWRDFPDRLCRRAGCAGIVYSRYGNGFSDVLAQGRAVRYMHDEANALAELLDALSIERCTLFGHSDGASIALIIAGTQSARFTSLVLEAPHVFVEPLSVKSIAAIGEVYRNGDMRARMGRHHADVDRTFFGWNDVWLSSDFVSWNITGCLAPISAPVLCIQGAGDEYGTPAQIDAIARGTSGSVDRLILDRCGHSPHRDRGDYVEVSAAAWLSGLR
ncbi:MAG TPA: alpha/beta hydrolase [Candidatus Baltobacteraceae bacterium]|nr:alpha/beta hydrolase [Candidatus Baltobacteraceae bacterium]